MFVDAPDYDNDLDVIPCETKYVTRKENATVPVCREEFCAPVTEHKCEEWCRDDGFEVKTRYVRRQKCGYRRVLKKRRFQCRPWGRREQVRVPKRVCEQMCAPVTKTVCHEEKQTVCEDKVVEMEYEVPVEVCEDV